MNITSFSLILNVFILFLSPNYILAGLYDKSDRVTILDASNFKDIVCHSSSAWIVQFYNSWCGHCVRFSPTYKVFARDVSEWWKVVRIGVVDCAEETNTPLCREYNVQSVPTIKLFGPQASETEAGEQYTDTKDVTTLRHGIIAMLERDTADKTLPPTWPSLNYISSTNSLSSISAALVALVVEPKSSFIGREIILDLSNRTDVSVSRILPDNAVGLPPAGGLPALYILNKASGQFTLKSSNIQNRTAATKLLQGLVGYVPKAETPVVVVQNKVTARPTNRPVSKVYMKDLESALLWSFTKEVAAAKYITAAKLDALKKYAAVLSKYFPGDHRVMTALSEVNDWISKKTALNGEQFAKLIKQVQGRHHAFPSTVKWRGCKGSSEKYRGYPCSVWVLFHTLTVNSVLTHGQDSQFDSSEVLVAMREYVRHFFGCRECADHFTQASAKLEQEIVSPDDSILYLWRSHNRANFHLKGDATEDPAHPKIQFPSLKDCPSCHSGGGFNESQVLVFLKALYGRNSIVLEADVKSRSRTKVYMQDLDSTLTYIFSQELARQKEVEGESSANLKKLLKVLYKYYPGDDETKSFLEEIDQWVTLRSEFTGEEWAAFVSKTTKKHPTAMREVKWAACQGSQPKFRGYPCGLWVLFHTLSVNAYTGHREKGTLGTFNPLEVLDAMRGYIHSFFGCRECSKNFAKMAAKLEVEVQDAEDSVTWLWHAHNRANKRLHGDKTEDPQYPKIQFPSADECPQCHVTIKSTNWDIPFSIEEVKKFLLNLYTKQNIVGWRPTSVDIERQKVNEMDEGKIVVAVGEGRLKDNLQGNDGFKEKGKLGDQSRDRVKLNIANVSSRVSEKPLKSRLERIRELGDTEMKTRLKLYVGSRSAMNSVDIGLCVVFYVACTLLILFLYFHLMVRRKHRLPCISCPV